MRTHLRFLLPLALVALLGACNGGGGGGTPSGNALVTSQISATSETAEPVSINDKTLNFSSDEHAFDALFQ